MGSKCFIFQQMEKDGVILEDVVMATPYQTVQLPNVILTERARAVMISGMGSVEIQHNIVHVGAVLTTTLQSGGENQGENKCGETTANVVFTIDYQTINKQNVIRTQRDRVVAGMECVGTQQNIVLVKFVWTTDYYTEIGGKQKESKSGDTMRDVVRTIPYPTVQQLNVIPTGRSRAAVLRAGEGVVIVTVYFLVIVNGALTMVWLTR